MANSKNGKKAPQTEKNNVNKDVVTQVQTDKVNALKTKEILSDYIAKANKRDLFHIEEKRKEDASLLHHLKDTQRREAELIEADIIPFTIDYKYFREGQNVFKLLGFLTPASAILYALTDKVRHSTAIKLLSDYSEVNYFANVTTIEAKFAKADILSEERKKFLATSKTEIQTHKFLLKVDSIFNVTPKGKDVKKYGTATAKALFKHNLYSLIQLQNSHFEVETIKKMSLDIVLSTTDKSKFNEAQKRFLLDNIEAKNVNKFLATGFETIEGGTKALELLNAIETAKEETKAQRSKVQSERKKATATATATA